MTDNEQIMYDENGMPVEIEPRRAGSVLLKTGEYMTTPAGVYLATNAAMPWYVRAGGALVGYAGLKKWTPHLRRMFGRGQ
jgi:hypothetical protein